MTDHPVTNYVKQVLKETGLTPTALAKLAKVSSTTLTRPLNDPDHPHDISMKTAAKIAAVTNIPFGKHIDGGLMGNLTDADVLERLDPEDASSGPSTLVPVFDVSASAGYGAINEYEPQTHSLAFPPDYLKKLTSGSPQNLAIISVKGDSMEPTLLDDDIVLLDTSKRNLGYDGLFVLLMDEVLHVKRIGRSSKTGHVSIISDNSTFPSLDREMGDIEPIGKVLWYGRKV